MRVHGCLIQDARLYTCVIELWGMVILKQFQLEQHTQRVDDIIIFLTFLQCEMETPTEIHCLGCRSKQQVMNPHLSSISFTSKKNAVAMNRSVWQGQCAKCGKNVKKFARGAGTNSVETPIDTGGEQIQ